MKNKHGGSRPNSGRPKKEPTKTINFRVPVDRAEEIKKLVSPYIKDLLSR